MAKSKSVRTLCADYFFLGRLGCLLDDLYDETACEHEDWPEYAAIMEHLDGLNDQFDLARDRLQKEQKALCPQKKN